MKSTYVIGGMHCQSCVSRLTSSLEAVPGVSSVRVSLVPPQAEVEAASLPDESSISHAVTAAGDYRLVVPGGESAATQTAEPSKLIRYYPLMLIVGFIVAGCAILQARSGTWDTGEFMADFMGGFFVVFAFFKLLNPRAFANAYSTYDVIAARSQFYSMAYPFIELGLGVAYLLRFQPLWTNVATLVLMLVGSAGVIRSLLDGRRIQCACLGTVFDLPMSTVTIVEDLGMAAMAAWMLMNTA